MKLLIFGLLLSGLAQAKCELKIHHSTQANYDITDAKLISGNTYQYSHESTYDLIINDVVTESKTCSFKNTYHYKESDNNRPLAIEAQIDKRTNKYDKACNKITQKMLKIAKKNNCTDFELRKIESIGLQKFSTQPGTVSYRETEPAGNNKTLVMGVRWLDIQSNQLFLISEGSNVDAICKILGFPGGDFRDADMSAIYYMKPMAFTPRIDVGANERHRVFVGTMKSGDKYQTYSNVRCYNKDDSSHHENEARIEQKDVEKNQADEILNSQIEVVRD